MFCATAVLCGLTCSVWQELVNLYMRAVQKKPAAATGGDPSAKDLSKMTAAEKRKEIARRRAEAQKEKVNYSTHIRTVVRLGLLMADLDRR